MLNILCQPRWGTSLRSAKAFIMHALLMVVSWHLIIWTLQTWQGDWRLIFLLMKEAWMADALQEGKLLRRKSGRMLAEAEKISFQTSSNITNITKVWAMSKLAYMVNNNEITRYWTHHPWCSQLQYKHHPVEPWSCSISSASFPFSFTFSTHSFCNSSVDKWEVPFFIHSGRNAIHCYKYFSTH